MRENPACLSKQRATWRSVCGVQVCSLEVSILLFCSVLGVGGFLGEVGGQTPSIMNHQGPFGKRGGLCGELKAERLAAMECSSASLCSLWHRTWGVSLQDQGTATSQWLALGEGFARSRTIRPEEDPVWNNCCKVRLSLCPSFLPSLHLSLFF